MTPQHLAAADLIELLELEPLDAEGGWFRRTYADANGTAILYLLGQDDASALHRLPGPEVWHHYSGAPVRLLVLEPDSHPAQAVEHRLGDDLSAGETPQVVVPGGAWQGAVSVGPWSLLGTTMAPGYDPGGFELGDHAALAETYPDARELIEEIARRNAHLLGE